MNEINTIRQHRMITVVSENRSENNLSVNFVEAVYVRNASKGYGVGKRRAQVLRQLNMNVKKGTM